MQMLTYYAEAWSWALFGNGLLNDAWFEAWVHRPMSPQIWNDFKDYRFCDIQKEEPNDYVFDKKTLDLLESVFYTYGHKSGFELEALGRSETPWRKARNGLFEFDKSNERIDSNEMKNYYKSKYIGD
ncbi:putative phage-associated protein [Metamycoplasma auris]|uniref:Putative phage-associated protein n=1 Tax=Metamycoplasma auris TaxID=51363 RepID=A0A2W7G2C0_9BACT|nr:putative phage-associated protein [Metamycoplasma auris]